MQRKLLGIINVDFDATGQPQIIYSEFVKYLRKKWEHNKAVDQLIVNFKKSYHSRRREVFYNILIFFGMRMKLVRLLKMCLNGISSTVRVVRLLSYMFPIKNGLKQGDASLSLLLIFSRVGC
jgi:hypothetical protein